MRIKDGVVVTADYASGKIFTFTDKAVHPSFRLMSFDKIDYRVYQYQSSSDSDSDGYRGYGRYHHDFYDDDYGIQSDAGYLQGYGGFVDSDGDPFY